MPLVPGEIKSPGIKSSADADNADKAQEISQYLAERTADISLYMSVGLLIFGLLVVIIMALLFKNHSKPELILKTFCIPLIIIFAVLLPIAGYTSEQMTPAIGLLGTIAGYILGKYEKNPADKKDDPS